MKRRLEPELLDLLAVDNPAAMASRHDLVRINRIMRQRHIMARAMRGFAQPRRVLDLGGGDGRFLLGVARLLPWRDVGATIADRQNLVDGATHDGLAALGWRCTVRQGEAFVAVEEMEPGTLVIANLFLHHLEEAALENLLASIAKRAAGIVACEPRRGYCALAASHLVIALGCNEVTRHDAVASVRAGFAGKELSALWPRDAAWTLGEHGALPFSHIFVAGRHAL